MSIQICHEAGRYVPAIVCDICGERIVGIEDGVVVYYSDLKQKPTGFYGEVLFAHKGVCMENAEQIYDKINWEMMSDFLGFLLKNIGVLPSKVHGLLGEPPPS